MVKKILSTDISVLDIIVSLAENPALALLADEYEFHPGGKYTISKEELQEKFLPAISGKIIKQAGGSSANVLWNLKKLLGDEIEVKFLSVLSGGRDASIIKKAMKKAGIEMLMPPVEKGQKAEQATSIVMKYDCGERAIATYKGNQHKIIKPEMVTAEMVQAADILFVQGSLWKKYPRTASNMNVPDMLLKYRQEFGKELWLAMPTSFAAHDEDFFQWLIPAARVVLSNDAELSRIYGGDIEKSLLRLQREFVNNGDYAAATKGIGEQVAFITIGEEGAAVVTRDEITKIPAGQREPHQLVNTLGAGDTACAGFLLGHLLRLDLAQSAAIAMALAAANIMVDGARLADPRAVLKKSGLLKNL